MMPSRGLMPIASAARTCVRATRISSRSLSTTSTKPPFRIRVQRPTGPTTNLIFQRNLSWSSFGLGGSFPPPNDARSPTSLPPSTEPQAVSGTVSTVSTPVPPTAAPVTASPADLPVESLGVTDLGTFDANAVQDVADSYMSTMPEQIGYLKSIGIDYGWGPTSILQYVLEHVHVYTGLPWWGSIMLTALSTRVVFFWAALLSSDTSARQQAMAPVTKPLTNKMMEAYKMNDAQGVQQIRAELKAINERAGVKMSRVFLPLLVQGMFAYCALKLMRAMAALPVPGLLDGGFLWVKDLSVADPTFALPVIMAGSMHVFVRYGGETGVVNDQMAGLRTMMLYVMPAIILVSMSWFPAAVNLWLSATGVCGIAQARILQNKGVRDYFRLAPLVKPPIPEPATTSSPAPRPNTIDVKGRSRAFSDSAKMRYQAPNIQHALSSSKRDLPAGPEDLPPISKGLFKRSREWSADKANDLGEGWTNLKTRVITQARQYRDARSTNKSSTRSKEFLKRAEAYEKKARARKSQ